jgi:beta-lactamase regulating signal transducer with metallopeptidase domain/protocatechuate 3,4-dioxygenase beta subunit
MTWHALVDPVLSGRLCLTLLHSVWQVALLALVVWCIDRLWRSDSIERRYAMNVAALVTALVAMPVTYVLIDVVEPESDTVIEVPILATVVESKPSTRTTSPVTIPPVEAELVVSAESQTLSQQVEQYNQTQAVAAGDSTFVARPSDIRSSRWLLLAPWIVALYAAGVVSMLTRLVIASISANRLSTRADLVTDGPLVEALRSLAQQWSMKAVPALARAEQIVVPKVVGLARPTILLPASAIGGLSVDELEMILAHELAHIRRYDMWVNLLQRLAETVLFFNPALWYLSRRISALREYCCDEMACREQSASAPEPRVRYATALLRIVELAKPKAAAGSDLASLAASGRSPSEIRRRVARLFGEPLREPLRVSRGGLLTLIALGAVLFLGPAVWNTRAEPPADQADSKKITDAKDESVPFEFRLKVVGPDGAPVPNAAIEIRTRPAPTGKQIHRGQFVRRGTYGTFAKTDKEARLTLTLPRRPKRLNISIKQPGYGPYWAGWDSTIHPQAIPLEFTAKLDAGWSVGGVVVDGAGQPVEGAKVYPSVEYKKRPGDTSQLGVGSRIVTDADGQWRFDNVPASKSDVHVTVNHPDYGPLRRRLPRNGFEVKRDAKPTARIELKRGLTVTGMVTDESGKPIVGALIRTKFHNDIREARTNDQGVYHLVGCEPRMARIVVSAKGRATDMQEVRVDPDMAPVDFSMKPGGKIRIRVVDEQGKGIPKTRIFFQRWRGSIDYFEFDHVSRYTDKNGVWEWNEAPLDEFKAEICRPGGMQLLRQSLIARDKEYVFTPPRALVVSGTVIDAVTKEPVKRFRVVPGVRNQPAQQPGDSWSLHDSYVAMDGKYRIVRSRTAPVHLVRIEAKGYKVAISRDIKTDEGEVNFDFKLQPAKDIAVNIVTAAGKPAAKAKIALGVAGSQISIKKGEIDDGSTFATRFDADVDGHFSFPAPDEPFQLVITHSSGFAYLKSADGPISNQIKLTPWARVEGTFRVGKQPAPNVVLSMFVEGIHSYGDDVPNIFTGHDVTTGKDGRFVFERAFPGRGRIGRRILLMVDDGATEVTSSLRVSAEFIAGKTTTLNLGGTGRPVVGKLAPPAGYSKKVLWNFALIKAQNALKPPPAPTPPKKVGNDPKKYQAWWKTWIETPAGRAWKSASESYRQLMLESPYITASVDRDGSFRIDDVPEGNYVLRVRFSKNAVGVLSGYRFAVPAVEEGRAAKSLELGTLTLDK